MTQYLNTTIYPWGIRQWHNLKKCLANQLNQMKITQNTIFSESD